MALRAMTVNDPNANRALGQIRNIPIWNISQGLLFSYSVKKSIHSSEQRMLRTLLRETREQAEMTQKQLSEKLGRSQSFVSKYEAGELGLDVLELRSICQAMDVPLLDFVRRFEDRLT